MGKQAMILVASLLVAFTVYSSIYDRSNMEVVRNYSSSYASIAARNITRSALEMTLGTLADSLQWRAGFTNVSLMDGNATVVLKDTVVGLDSVILVKAYGNFMDGKDTAAYLGIVMAKGSLGVPPSVRGAITAFGPLDRVISDMVIDGRDHAVTGALVSGTGKFGVSTGAPALINTKGAFIGGTDQTVNPPNDIAPNWPQNPKTVETSADWNGKFPQNPDQALGIPEGMLEKMAQAKVIPGSQFVTKYSDLVFPLRGITYIKVEPKDTWSHLSLGTNPSGLLVFHNDSTDAFWNNIKSTGPFTGLMIFDNIFHIHMNITGALIILDSNTISNKNCYGNNGKQILYSSEAITAITGKIRGGGGIGGWRDKLVLLSWSEERLYQGFNINKTQTIN